MLPLTSTTVSLSVLEPNLRRRFQRHVGRWEECRVCAIGSMARQHVFARGQLPCDVLFLGEGPGKQENESGFPFIGRAGRLLDEWIQASQSCWIPNRSYSYAISNLVACRPCDSAIGANRPPSEQEQTNCRPRLKEFIDIAKPKAFVLLGRHAHQAFAGTELGCDGQPIMKLELKHPAYVLRLGGSGSLESEHAKTDLCHFIGRLATEI